jgi:hypothetical protein
MYTHQEALEKRLVAPSGFLTAGCGCQATAEKRVKHYIKRVEGNPENSNLFGYK